MRRNAFIVLNADGRHDAIGRLVAPGEARADGGLRRIQQYGEKIVGLRRVGCEIAILDEFFDSGVGFRAFDAINRRSIIARQFKQTLNARETRLFLVIFGRLAEIDNV